MGIDGMPASAGRLTNEIPSSHHAINADMLANMKKDDMVVDFDQFTRNQQIGRKEDNYGEDVENQSLSAGYAEDSVENENISDENDDESSKIIYYEKRYILRLNENNATVELYDNEKDEVIDTIEAENLFNIASKLRHCNGIVVDKTI